MTPDVPVQDLIPLNDAVAMFPKRPHYSTLWRWASRGVRGQILRTHTIGGSRFTTRQWVSDFIASQTHAIRPQALSVSTQARLQAERLV